MEIKILGGGCAKCNRLEKLARDVVTDLSVDAVFGHVRDMDKIMAYDITSTPALVIDEEVKCFGRVPRKHEVVDWIREAAAA